MRQKTRAGRVSGSSLPTSTIVALAALVLPYCGRPVSAQTTALQPSQCSFDLRYSVTGLKPSELDALVTITSNRDESAPLQLVYRFAKDAREMMDLAYVNNAVIVTKGNGTLGIPTRLKTSRSYRQGQRAEIAMGVVAVNDDADAETATTMAPVFSPSMNLGLEDVNVNGLRCERLGNAVVPMEYEKCMNAMTFFTSFNGRPPPTGGATDECAMDFCCGVVPVAVAEEFGSVMAPAPEASDMSGGSVGAKGPETERPVSAGNNAEAGQELNRDGGEDASFSGSSSSSSTVLIGAVVGVGVLLVVAFFVSCVIIRRRRQRRVLQDGNNDGDNADSQVSTPRKQLSLKSTASGFSTPTNRVSVAASTIGVNSHHLTTQGSLCMATQHTQHTGLPTPIDHLPDDLPEDVILHEKLGAGAFGTVFRGAWGGHTVAVKVLQTAYASNSREMDSFRQEIAVLSGLRHPNIVAFLAACTIPPDICIVEELAEGGSLHTKLHGTSGEENRCRPMPANEVIRVAIDVAQAMVYLHPNIVHRDLKSQNVLLDAEGRAKVCDFGIAKFKDRTFVSTVNGQAGTPAYMAPELFDGINATEKVDVYSFAVLLWECLTGKVPWGHVPSPMQIIYYVGVLNQRPAMPSDGSVPKDLEQLIQDCWVVDPKKRPGFDTVLERLRAMQPEQREGPVSSRPASAADDVSEDALKDALEDSDDAPIGDKTDNVIYDKRSEMKPSSVIEVEATTAVVTARTQSLVDRVKSFSIL